MTKILPSLLHIPGYTAPLLLPSLVTWRELCVEEQGAQYLPRGPGHSAFSELLTLKSHRGSLPLSC